MDKALKIPDDQYRRWIAELSNEGIRRAADRNNTGICDASWYSILRAEH